MANDIFDRPSKRIHSHPLSDWHLIGSVTDSQGKGYDFPLKAKVCPGKVTPLKERNMRGEFKAINPDKERILANPALRKEAQEHLKKLAKMRTNMVDQFVCQYYDDLSKKEDKMSASIQGSDCQSLDNSDMEQICENVRLKINSYFNIDLSVKASQNLGRRIVEFLTTGERVKARGMNELGALAHVREFEIFLRKDNAYKLAHRRDDAVRFFAGFFYWLSTHSSEWFWELIKEQRFLSNK